MKETNQSFERYSAKLAELKQHVVSEISINQDNPEKILYLKATSEKIEQLDELFKNPASYPNSPSLSEKELEEKYPGILFVISELVKYLKS